MAESYGSKVIDHISFGWDFPTGSEKATVFGTVDPLNVFFHHSHTQKALPCVKTRRLSHQPLILVQAFDLWTCARKKEGKGWLRKCVKKGTEVLYFTHVPRSPLATDCYQNLYIN